MKKRIWWLGAVAFILSFWIVAPFCYAANWDYVCASKDGTSYYLDISSVEKQGEYLRFWRKGVHQESQDGEKEFRSYHEVHLANSLEIRMLQIVSYDDNGNVIRNYSNPTEWQSLRSGSILYALANAAMHYAQ